MEILGKCGPKSLLIGAAYCSDILGLHALMAMLSTPTLLVPHLDGKLTFADHFEKVFCISWLL